MEGKIIISYFIPLVFWANSVDPAICSSQKQQISIYFLHTK